jgi:hypothetical protein
MLVMPKIQPDSLMTLEAYARNRKEFRAKVMAHKKDRSVALGDHVTLVFEDELTIRYWSICSHERPEQEGIQASSRRTTGLF